MKGSRFDGELRWLHKVRLYPTCAQQRALIEILRTTRALYNALLQQRRDAWTTRRTSVSSKQQYAEITDLRAVEPRFANVWEGPRFACVRCRHQDDADVNAARVILLRAESPPTRAPGNARGAQHDAA
jgi:transposase